VGEGKRGAEGRTRIGGFGGGGLFVTWVYWNNKGYLNVMISIIGKMLIYIVIEL
jgi:hypothetical protein